MESFSLISRGIFHDIGSGNSSFTNNTCPSVTTAGPAIVPLVGKLTYHQVATIISGACGIATAIIALGFFALHAMNYSNPVQQRQVLRVVLLTPWISLWAFLIVWRDDVGDYLVESLDFGCAIALSSFLLLMCDYVLSHPSGFDELFGQGALARGAFVNDSPGWLRNMWYGVLQFIPTSLLLWIATAVSLAVGSYCKQSNSIHFAHVWITAFKFVVTTIAILSTLRFYGKHKVILKKHNIFFKLFTFKGVIGLNFFQTFIISVLCGDGKLKPSKYMTYHDVNNSLASLILACEMPIFAILIAIAFPVKPYKNNGGAAAGPLSAVVDALNITDLLSAFVRGPMRLVRDQHRQILRQESERVEMGAGPAPIAEEHERMIKPTYQNTGSNNAV